jgi:hypothetical protein
MHALWMWIIAYWPRFVTFIALMGIVIAWPGWKLAVSVWKWLRERRHKRLSQMIIAKAREERKSEPNIHCHPKAQIVLWMGPESHYVDDVLDYMRDKNLAIPVYNPPDCWRIT